MASNQPYNQELGTYFQNGLRSDILKVKSPLGYGVPLSPLVSYQFVPKLMEAGDLVKSASVTVNKPLTFSTTTADGKPSPYYVPATNNSPAYLQLDCLRCLELIFSGTASSAVTSSVTIKGRDDRGVALWETLTREPSASSTVKTISNKAYLYVDSITYNTSPAVSVSVTGSNTFFGSHLYLGNPLTFISGFSAVMDTEGYNVSDRSQVNSITGLNFRKVPPNNLPTDNAGSIDPAAGTESQGDARGLFYLGEKGKLETVTGKTIINVTLYAHGADAELNAEIAAPSENGSVLLQRSSQYVVSGLDPYLANDPLQPNLNINAPTQMTPFDLFGAQYPGDATLYNQLYGQYGKKMAV